MKRLSLIRRLATDRLLFGRKVEGSLSDVGSMLAQSVGFLLLIAFTLLGAGVTLPLFSVTKVYIWTDQVSIFSGIMTLLDEGEYLLAFVILAFSIIAPIVKIGFVHRAWRRVPAASDEFVRWLARVEVVSRWSMLEVLIVAVIVMAAKAGNFADAQTQIGIYCFLGSLVLVTLSIHVLKREAKKLIPPPASLTV